MAAAPGSERNEDRRPGPAGVGRPAWVGDRPVPLTPIVGREREAAALRDLLLDRVAIEVASTLEMGFATVAFVPLAQVGDAGLGAATIARVLGLQVGDETAVGDLSAYLEPRTMLLILDNVEHLPAAGPLLVELLGAGHRYPI
jgi:hypothetical protein